MTQDARAAAIRDLNAPTRDVLISLLRSQTVDLYAARLSEPLRAALEALRARAPDAVKVAVDAIHPLEDGYEVVLDSAAGTTLQITEGDAGPFTRTLGGGLCNLSKDLEVILDALYDEDDDSRPRPHYLTWQDGGEAFPGTLVEGRSRTSLIFRTENFEKLILTERGPSYDATAIDLWQQEQEFYRNPNAFLFIGQEPVDSRKFAYILERKVKEKGSHVFWLVGGNQLKKLYTEYRQFLSIVDVVSLNLQEAAHFFAFEPLRRRHRNATELRIMYAKEISRRVLDYGANHVVITDGAKGASLARKARGGKVEFVYSPLIHENSIEVDPGVREDTGCGDSFAAAIAAYYLASRHHFKMNEAANFAHFIAGIIYQRRRPNLTEKDKGFVEYALHKARDSGAFVGKHETFNRDTCQIRPAPVVPRGPRRNVLVLILGDDPSDPDQPSITGADIALEALARQCRSGTYALAPLIRIVPRLSVGRAAAGRLTLRQVERPDMMRLIDTGQLCKELGTHDASGPWNGILAEDLRGHEGVYLLRVTLLEALEVLSSEDFAELFSDIKLWHFATENVDERLVWFTKTRGVSRDQSQEIIRQALRDNLIRAQSPQVRFAGAQATNLDDFERELTEQLILRLDALLAGVFREG